MDAQYPVGQHFDVEPNHYFADDLSPTHTSPPTSALAWPSHRTSSTRDDFARVKHESPMNDRVNGNSSRSSDDPMPSTSDFVKKLYKMLEDPTFQSVVSWGPQGDCFVVKDMNEFTKSILPRMFKHSNFASFVRQLNKYDFHKVKNTDDNQFGEHSWTFRHPDFHADRRDALENIKRKVPAQRKTQSASIVPLSSLPYPSSTRGRSTSPVSLGNLPPHLSTMHGNTYASVPVLQAETQRLREENDDLRGRIRNLERNYESVLVEMVAFQRGIAQQDGLMQNMISYFLANQNVSQGKAPQLPGAEPQGLRLIPPTNPSSADSPASMSQDPSSSSTVQHLQAQLRQQQSHHGRSQIALQALLNQQSRERKRHEIADMQDRPPSPASQSQEPQQFPQPEIMQPQPSSANTSSTSMLDPLQDRDSVGGLPSLLDTNPFLPPHTVQRIIASGAPARPFTPNGNELGRASLLQMNELSRRAAYLGTTGEDGNLWSEMNFSSDSPSSSQQQEGRQYAQNPQGNKPARGLDQPREVYREMVKTAWNGSTVPPTSADGAGFATRTTNDERERVGFNVSMARDDSGSGMRTDTLEDHRGRPRRRNTDSNFVVGAGGVGQSDGFAQVQTFSPDSKEQTQPMALSSESLKSSSSTQASTKPQTTVPDLWASRMSDLPVMDAQNILARSGTIEDDGSLTHEGLQVYTVGHLLPKGIGIGGSEDLQDWLAFDSEAGQSGVIFGGQEQSGGYQDLAQFTSASGEDEDEVVQPTPSNSLITPGAAASLSSSESRTQKIRVRRSTYVPGWAVPPRVLLVDDDAVSRKLSSKFLKVFGCTIDVAVDGLGAVNKMNLEKYDLVLMDIVMPKLDGVSATSLIRKFDQGTPIISMTSNSKPNEIMTYYSSGMNDILPKPFTKEGLLDMLEKHLMHLKVMQQMSKLPRSISTPMLMQGFGSNLSTLQSMQPGSPFSNLIESPSASDGATSTNPATGLTSGRSTPGFLNFGGTYDGEINPLAGMGLTDDQYTLILQNMVNGDGFLSMMDEAVITGSMEKRSLEDLGEDGRNKKRSRFETIE